MFVADSRTRTSWFHPRSLEPLYKYELLGLLVSLAIYNGLTLPVNFPIALYRKLLGWRVTGLEHIRDGWPELSRGLQELLTWADGDVGDVFVRTYDFSIEAWGETYNDEMERAGTTRRTENSNRKGKAKATSPSLDQEDEAPTRSGLGSRSAEIPSLQTDQVPQAGRLVTNENRERYVKDYIDWLINRSIQPQYEAFSRGFFTCVEKKALSVSRRGEAGQGEYPADRQQIFTAESLQRLVQGVHDLDIDGLEQTARYEDGFSADHWLIKDFWAVLKAYRPEKQRALLEFVTASDRVPVNGIRSVLFVIQKNGPDSDVSESCTDRQPSSPPLTRQRLPTSLTCFGRLLLPEYSSRKKLRDKMDVALENGKGFGVP